MFLLGYNQNAHRGGASDNMHESSSLYYVVFAQSTCHAITFKYLFSFFEFKTSIFSVCSHFFDVGVTGGAREGCLRKMHKHTVYLLDVKLRTS